MLKVLAVSQALPQWLVDQLKIVLPEGAEVDFITGSKVTNANIISAPSYVNKSYFTKLLSWFRFTWFVTRWGRKNKKGYDLIIATSNPPFNSTTMSIIKDRMHCPFIFINWDIYPQGVINENSRFPLNIAFKVWNRINNIYYPRIDRIVTIGESMKKFINDYLKQPLDISVIPISVDINKIKPIIKKDNIFLNNNHINSKWVVLYSGAMGYSKNIELLLETAKVLKSNKDITFVLIGHGPKYTVAEKILNENSLDNVRLFPLQPDNIYPYSISCGDVVVLPEKITKDNASIPSKTYSMMAAGEAVIAIGHKKNDLSQLIMQNNIGEVIDIEDARLLASTITNLLNDELRLNSCKRNARELAVKKFSFQATSEMYRNILRKTLNKL